MPIPNRRLFGPQHWNAIAKDIRLEYAEYPSNRREHHIARRTLESLALRFAHRFDIDNEDFDPVKWLNQCSPDPDQYPIGDLWNG